MNAVVTRVDITLARLPTPGEEGFREKAYNDATGRTVTCKTMTPAGNLTIGPGINLENGITPEEGRAISRIRLLKMDAALRQYAWYTELDEVRGSVFLDIAYQNGTRGELLHFPHVITAVAAKNWQLAHDMLIASPIGQKFAGRYKPLAELLLHG